jgi:hypothetical protein
LYRDEISDEITSATATFCSPVLTKRVNSICSVEKLGHMIFFIIAINII